MQGMVPMLAQNEVAVNLTLPGIIALVAGVLILIYSKVQLCGGPVLDPRGHH